MPPIQQDLEIFELSRFEVEQICISIASVVIYDSLCSPCPFQVDVSVHEESEKIVFGLLWEATKKCLNSAQKTFRLWDNVPIG